MANTLIGDADKTGVRAVDRAAWAYFVPLYLYLYSYSISIPLIIARLFHRFWHSRALAPSVPLPVPDNAKQDAIGEKKTPQVPPRNISQFRSHLLPQSSSS